MTNLVWFRSDLRITDNPALNAALQSKPLRALFIVCVPQWKLHDWGQNKISFVLEGVEELRRQLASLNIDLDILECATFKEIPSLLSEYVKQKKISHLFYNQEYELNEQQRDQNIEKVLPSHNIKISSFHDQCLIAPGVILTQKDTPYTVFTPFKKSCYKYLDGRKFDIDIKIPNPARTALADFCTEKISTYASNRDFPALDGTSKLSAYLAIGAISVRECYEQARNAGSPEEVLTWIDELLWRDFYRNITYHFPDICKGHNFNRKYDNIAWRKPGVNLYKWQNGETGIPIIDAAMKQLITTGWMHNRLRMVVAMFLTKNLLIDWRHGEKFFAQHLNDLDFSSNNGGWQWSASTGTDAAPYFRIFNPLTQSAKFDPNCLYIRKYCPELKLIDCKQLHNPDPKDIIVDLKASRMRAIAAYKDIQ